MPNIVVRPILLRGERVWQVDARSIGQGRVIRQTKDRAEAEAAQLRQSQRDADLGWLNLSARERNELASAYRDAKARGHDLQRLIAAGPVEPRQGPTLIKTIEELVSAKLKSGRSRCYVEGALEPILNQFARGMESKPIAAVDHVDVERFLDSKKIASRSTLRSRISTLFGFAVRRGYRADNPCDRLESVKLVKTPPAIFTIEQFKTCWSALSTPFKPSKYSRQIDYRHARPWFVLTTLCGLRPEEAMKTRKADVHFREGWIRVEAQTSKIRQRRIIYARPEAMKLLKRVIKCGRLPLSDMAKQRTIWRLRAALKLKTWPKDLTRHSAASLWIAGGESVSRVAEFMGTSESILKRDYKALLTRRQANEFWSAIKRLSS